MRMGSVSVVVQARRSPSELQVTVWIREVPACNTQSSSPLEVSQSLTVPSQEPEASRGMNGCQLMVLTKVACPSRTLRTCAGAPAVAS